MEMAIGWPESLGVLIHNKKIHFTLVKNEIIHTLLIFLLSVWWDNAFIVSMKIVAFKMTDSEWTCPGFKNSLSNLCRCHNILVQNQDNISVQYIPPYTPILYSKTGVCRDIPHFLIFI